jgi:4-hydroxy-2-oxoheptanedioate aldolase
MTNSRVLRRLRDGDFVRVAGIGRVTGPWLCEVVGNLGFDCVWLDLKHRTFGPETIGPMSLACRATQMDLMVHILKTGYDAPMRALEAGANGIMVPHCRSAAEARQWVEWTRFPPLGRRGMDGAGVDADYMLADMHEYLRHANEETFLVLQIEDREAVECIDEMASIPGFDMLFVGPGDLSLSYGVPFQFNHPDVQRAHDRVANAAARHGKFWGTTSGTPEAAQREIDRGAQMVTCGADHVFLVQGFQNSFERFKTLHARTLQPA